MNKKGIMKLFLQRVEDNKLITLFIKNIFNYDVLYDYNYLYRSKDEKKAIVIDIYDNVSDNRFNRYVFNFYSGDYDIKIMHENNVFVTYIYILNVKENLDNNLLKFSYLFNLRKSKMIEYAKTFLSDDFVLILKDILEKPIYK